MSSKLLYISGREGGRGERGGRRNGGRGEEGERREGGREGVEKEREGRRRKKGRGEGHSTATYNVHTCYHEYTTVPFRELSGGLVKVFADGDCGSSLCVTQLDILEKSVGHKLCVCVCV